MKRNKVYLLTSLAIAFTKCKDTFADFDHVIRDIKNKQIKRNRFADRKNNFKSGWKGR